MICKYIILQYTDILFLVYSLAFTPNMAYWEVNIPYLEGMGYTQMHLEFPPAKNLQFNRTILNQITIKRKFHKFTIHLHCLIPANARA